MEHKIISTNGITVTLEDGGAVTIREHGKLPSLDDLARERAYSRYMAILDDPSLDDWRSLERSL